MADTEEFLDDLLNAHAQEFKAGHLDTIKKAILQHFQQEQEKRVGLLRQWLNEDRITDPNKMVTNEEIEVWLSKQKEGSK